VCWIQDGACASVVNYAWVVKVDPKGDFLFSYMYIFAPCVSIPRTLIMLLVMLKWFVFHGLVLLLFFGWIVVEESPSPPHPISP
jgi:hypothetical protein